MTTIYNGRQAVIVEELNEEEKYEMSVEIGKRVTGLIRENYTLKNQIRVLQTFVASLCVSTLVFMFLVVIILALLASSRVPLQ